MGTAIVGITLIVIVSQIIKSMIKNVKKGKSITGCNGDCGHCHHNSINTFTQKHNSCIIMK